MMETDDRLTRAGSIETRLSSPYHLAGNRNAAHPVNEILNYADAALEGEIRIKAISKAMIQLGSCAKAATDRRNSYSI